MLSDAKKLTDYPIPFPLAQMLTFMLLIHFICSVFVCATSIDSMLWAGLLAFLVIIAYWSINYIALELEMPFGDDFNDLPMQDLQKELNISLVELMDQRSL